MATSAQTSPVVSRRKAPGGAGKYFYFFMSLLVAAIVIYGFSHSVDQNLVHANPPRPWLLWVHGTLFSAWVAFFILQSALVRTGNVRIHRTTGWFGAALAAAMTLVGFTTAVVMARFDIRVEHAQAAQAFLMVPFWDIGCFTVFFWLAVAYRKKPEMHRRLILIATCALASAAFGRFPDPRVLERGWFYFGVDGLILLGVVRDLVVTRRVHRVYLYALPVLALGQWLVVHTYTTSASWWMRIAGNIVG